MMKQIEGLLVFRFREDAAFKAAWMSARNIKWPSGVERGGGAEAKGESKAS